MECLWGSQGSRTQVGCFHDLSSLMSLDADVAQDFTQAAAVMPQDCPFPLMKTVHLLP